MGNVLACGGITAALADAAVSLSPQGFKAPVHAAVIVGVIGGFALVNLGGVARGARLIGFATVAKLIPLLIFLVAGMGAIHRANFVQAVAPSTQGLGRALILALFVLTGMEVSLSASGEVKQSARTIPRALGIALVTVTLLYIAIQVIAQGMLGASLPQSTVPLADAMAKISPGLRVLMLAGAALSMVGWVASDILGSPRILFAFGRDGLLPRALGRVHPRTPYRDSLLCDGRYRAGAKRNVCRACGACHPRQFHALCRRLRRGLAAGAQRRGSGRHTVELSLAGHGNGGRGREHAADDCAGLARGSPWPPGGDCGQRDRLPGPVPNRGGAATSRVMTSPERQP